MIEKNDKILIVGMGFLGKNLRDELEAEGYTNVVGVGSRDYDLTSDSDAWQLFKDHQPDVVFALASLVGGIQANRKHPADFFWQNMLIGGNLIHQAAMYDGLKKFVQVGTTCFTKDALIKVSNSYKEINLIQEGEIVSQLNKTGSIRKIFKRLYSGKMFSIRPYGCEELQVTSEHPFFVFRNGIYQFLNAEDVKKDDYLVIKKYHFSSLEYQKINIGNYSESYRVKNLPNKNSALNPEIVIDEDVAYFLGWFIAEGCTTSKSDIILYFGDEESYIRKISDIIRNKFNRIAKITHCKNQKGFRVSFYSNQLSRWLRKNCYSSNSHTSHHKIIPDIIYHSPESVVKSLIRGYFEGDGCLSSASKKNDSSHYFNLASVASTSRSLMYQFKDILYAFNIHGSLFKRNKCKNEILGRKVNCKDSWCVRITGKNLDLFLKEFFPSISSIMINDSRLSKYSKQIFYNKDFVHIPIYSISNEIKTDIEVYNLSTEDETYSANSVIVHNCSYGDKCPIPFKEESLFTELPNWSNRSYGVVKLSLLYMLDAYAEQYGLRSNYIIPVNMAGKYDTFDEDRSHFIPAIIKKVADAIANNSPSIEVWGDGSGSREIVRARDVAGALRLAMENLDQLIPINVGSGKEYFIKDTVQLICDIMGYRGDIVWNTSMPVGQQRRCMDISRAKQYLGWEPTSSLEDTIKETVEWYNARKD